MLSPSDQMAVDFLSYLIDSLVPTVVNGGVPFNGS